MNTIKFNKEQTQIVAHRGVSGIERENTAAAFIAAGNRSYYGIETDIWRTADGHFLCNHDGNLKRVAGVDISVENSTLAELQAVIQYDKSVDAADSTDRRDLIAPTLENYVSICKKYEKIGVLELKSIFTDEEIAKIIEIIESYDYLDGIIFIAFNYDNLVKVKKLRPNQTVQFLTKEVSDELIEKLAAAGMDADIHHPSLTEERIKAFHAKGVKLNCWTVDTPERAEELASWGVDYITTNILE